MVALNGAAPEQMVRKTDIGCPLSVPREVNKFRGYAIEVRNELLQPGVVPVQLSAELLTDHVKLASIGAHSRRERIDRSCRQLNGLPWLAVDQARRLGKRPNIRPAI